MKNLIISHKTPKFGDISSADLLKTNTSTLISNISLK